MDDQIPSPSAPPASSQPLQGVTVDREQVRLLCVAIGVRETARRLGLNVNTVLQWSRRGKWNIKQQPTPSTVTVHPRKNDKIRTIESGNQSVISPTVINPAITLQSILNEAENDTKLSLAKATKKAAGKLAEMPSGDIITKSKSLVNVTTAAAKLHGWDSERSAGSGLVINVGVSMGGMD